MLAEDGVLRSAVTDSRSSARCPRPIRGSRYTRVGPAFRRGRRRAEHAAPLRPATGARADGRAGSAAAAVPRRLARRGAQALRRVAVSRAPTTQRSPRRCESAIAALPPTSARLRVLEIGAGTGGTTTYVLPRCPRTASSTRSPTCRRCSSSARRAVRRPTRSSSTRLLDIERDPAAQGFAAGALRRGHRRQRAARHRRSAADAARMRAACWRRAGCCCCSRASPPSAGST